MKIYKSHLGRDGDQGVEGGVLADIKEDLGVEEIVEDEHDSLVPVLLPP